MPDNVYDLWRFTGQSWLPLAGFCLTLLLGFYVWARRPGSTLHRSFAILNITAALWNLDVFLLFTIQDGEIAGAVDRLFQPAVLSLPFLALLFIYVFLGRRPYHPVLLLFGLWTILLWHLSAGESFIAGWERHWFGFYGKAGELYKLFPLTQAAYLLLSVPPLWRESRRAEDGLRRSQAFFLLLANLAFGLLSIDNFAPLYGGQRLPVGNLAAVVYFFIVAATIVRHRLLDVEVVIRYGLLYSGLTFTLSAIYLLLVLGLQGWFHVEVFSGSIAYPMVAALVLALAVVPLKRALQGWIDHSLFPVRTRMKALLVEFPSFLAGLEREEDIWRTAWERGWCVVNPCWALVEVEKDGVLEPTTIGRKESGRNGTGRGGGAGGACRHGLAVPVKGKDGLLGCCRFGGKANGVTYGAEEVSFLRAIAAQSALAVERARVMEESRRQDRLATLGKAAAVVSHEMRNPLNVIKGAAALLRARLSGDEAVPILTMVEEEVRRGDRFITDFLAACREPFPRRTAVEMASFVRDFADRCNRGDGPPAAVAAVVTGEGIYCDVDPFQLQQVFENLVRNSVEAAGGEAKVTIRCRRARGGEVHLAVSDTGPGISREMLAQAFEPFQTSRRNGTGLGLSIVKSIVDAHGGRITVCNTGDGGARFDLRLPGAPGPRSGSGPVLEKTGK